MTLIWALVMADIIVTHACYGPYRAYLFDNKYDYSDAIWLYKDHVPDVMDPNALVGNTIVIDDGCYTLQRVLYHDKDGIAWTTSPLFTGDDGYYTVSFNMENTCGGDSGTGSSYTHLPQTCVYGHNLAKYQDKYYTVRECQKLCDVHSDCKAFEYGVNYNGDSSYSAGDCLLQSGTDTSDCDATYYNMDLYIKPGYEEVVPQMPSWRVTMTGKDVVILVSVVLNVAAFVAVCSLCARIRAHGVSKKYQAVRMVGDSEAEEIGLK